MPHDDTKRFWDNLNNFSSFPNFFDGYCTRNKFSLYCLWVMLRAVAARVGQSCGWLMIYITKKPIKSSPEQITKYLYTARTVGKG